MHWPSVHLNCVRYRLTAVLLKVAICFKCHFIFPVFGDDYYYFYVSVVRNSHVFTCILVLYIYVV